MAKFERSRETQKNYACFRQYKQTIFPNIIYLLRVLVTLPVSEAEIKRSFSSLKVIKPYLINSEN